MSEYSTQRQYWLDRLGIADNSDFTLADLERLAQREAGEKPRTSPATVAAASKTGVVAPAASVYTDVDQTALANAVISAVDQVNALRTALIDLGFIK